MNTVIQCIVLLACMGICTSSPILRCQCVQTSKSVRFGLIADVKVYNPRPYCDNKEVIVQLKDKSSLCLDPEGRFTVALLKTIAKRKAERAKKMNTSVTRTTTVQGSIASTTAPATIVPTS